MTFERLRRRLRAMMTGVTRKAFVVAAAIVALAACKDKGAKSEEEARANVKSLITLADKDVGEIERGLPEGGKKMTALIGKEDPKANPPAVRQALLKMRQQVPDLG